MLQWALLGAGTAAALGGVAAALSLKYSGRKQTLSQEKYRVKAQRLAVQSGNKNLWGKLLVPQAKEKVPLVICAHGYTANYHTTETLVGRTLAQSGIACYCFDFYGGGPHSKSGGSMMEMTPLTEKEELLDVIESVVKLELVDKDNVFLFGESMGGLVTALAANETSANIRGVVLYYPAFPIPEFAREFAKTGRPESWPGMTWSGASAGADAGELPETFAVSGKRLSRRFITDTMSIHVYEDIREFDRPVLIVHRDADSAIDISYGRRAAECYPHAQFVRLEHEPHGFTGKGKMRAVRHVYEFIQNNASLKPT